jgi:hypothetical protein
LKGFIDSHVEDSEKTMYKFPKHSVRKWIGDFIECAEVFDEEMIICTRKLRNLMRFNIEDLKCTNTKQIENEEPYTSLIKSPCGRMLMAVYES